MGATPRALRALVLLCCFHLLGLGLLALLGAVDWAAWRWAAEGLALKIYVVTLLLAVPVVRGMAMLRAPGDDGAAGVPVTEAEEPRLWQAVRELAERVGTRAPDEIRLTADVNAAVTEESRLLGLIGGTRRLYLGLPLVAGMTEAELRSVLAHELGHYSNADTRLSAITERCRLQVVRTVTRFEDEAGLMVAEERARQLRKSAKRVAKGKAARKIDTTGVGFTYRTMARIYSAYGRFAMRATRSDARRQEFAADLAAARIAGRDATASSLRRLPGLDAAHDFYLASYASLGVEFGMLPLPGEVFGGVRHLLDARAGEPAGSSGADGRWAEPPDEPSSPYDSHPPTAERVARIEALPDDGRAAEGSGPAFGLFASPRAVLVAVEEAALDPDALRMRRLDWPELVHASMAARHAREAEPVRDALGSAAEGVAGVLDELLDAIDAGTAWEVVGRLPRSEAAAAATGRAVREFARSALRRRLSHLAVAVLAEDGRARWRLSWSAPASLHLSEGYAEGLSAALDAAITDRPDTEPLRALLAAGPARTLTPPLRDEAS